jgi:hypothetical protein
VIRNEIRFKKHRNLLEYSKLRCFLEKYGIWDRGAEQGDGGCCTVFTKSTGENKSERLIFGTKPHGNFFIDIVK